MKRPIVTAKRVKAAALTLVILLALFFAMPILGTGGFGMTSTGQAIPGGWAGDLPVPWDSPHGSQ